jgi:hypothetical protein
MPQDSIIDTLEVEYGTQILSDLTGQHLTRNGQHVRLFDQTRHTSETFFRNDGKGKPYIQDWQEGKRWYPFTAYREAYQLDAATAIKQLCHDYQIQQGEAVPRPARAIPLPPPAVVPVVPSNQYELCRTKFERNGLFVYLSRLFSPDEAASVFEQYRLGTSRRWLWYDHLATCLPQIDVSGNLRQVKVIPFCADSGRRAKKHDVAKRRNPRTSQYEADTADKVYFAGKTLLGQADTQLIQCFFGEHLLATYPGKAVALVEGESTALVMSVVWPEYVWLATGGSTGGGWDNPDKFAVLRGRNVVLFPDSGKYGEWSRRADALQGIAASLTVSHYVEDNATGPNLDLRDLLQTTRWQIDGVCIKPEYLPDVPYSDYPAEWDAPHHTQSRVVGSKPYIGPPMLPPPKTPCDTTPCVSATAFHKWQQQHEYFGRMGLASLAPEQQATLRGNT